jgi:Fe2+ transport system protein B
MTEINKILAQYKLTIDELPNRIQQKINYFGELKNDLEETQKELAEEKDEETRKEIRSAILEAESVYEEVLGDIAEEISEFAEEKANHERKVAAQRQAAAQRQKEEKPKPTQQNQGTPDAKTDNTKPQKKSGVLGWFIGGAILVVTLGAVNVMNRK